ncbi:hypothetical protein MCOR32_008117 [Pyricularia oryzae]|nr:hypothetical protein MCOR32_008117 [Pyricularia oryzae]
MRFFIIVSAVLVGYVSAQAQCFDAGDCILSGGGQCVKDANQLLGLDPSKAPTLQVFSAMEFKYYEMLVRGSLDDVVESTGYIQRDGDRSPTA